MLPESILLEAQAELLNWQNLGMSVMEIGHRTPQFQQLMEHLEADLREVACIPANYHVLFLGGAARTQFAMVPMNFLGRGQKAAYLDAGYFGQKAIKEAGISGEVVVMASSKEDDYKYIPREYTIPVDAAYFHITSNNTIEGTEMFRFPKSPVPVVCDMSSDIFSRVIDITAFDLVYAGAQKNMGPAGMTLVIARNSFLDSIKNKVHAILDYRVYRDNGSMYNTPPVFAIYTAMLNLQWLKSKGGVKFIQMENLAKAQLLYDEIDSNPLFYGLAKKGDRSLMNVTFRMHDAAAEAGFLEYASKKGMVGIRGYRTVGGFRASLYNALPYESVQALVSCMKEYARIQHADLIPTY